MRSSIVALYLDPCTLSLKPYTDTMLNILTIDLEDYYQVSAFEGTVKREDWDKHESRIERNTYRLLEILAEAGRAHPSFVPPYAGLRRTSSAENIANEPTPNSSRIARSAERIANEPTPVTSGLEPCAGNVPPQTSNLRPKISDPSPAVSDSSPCTLRPVPCAQSSSSLHLTPCTPDVSSGVKATFFCLGWNAARYPQLIKEIHRQGHEIASHGYDHRLVYDMRPEQFREDIRKSKQILEDIIGEKVAGYRAPSYSITGRSLWAFQILAEEGFRYDSSIFPIHHDRYGIPDAPRFPFAVDLNNGGSPKFIPLSDDTRSALCSMPYAQTASTLHPPTSNGEPPSPLAPNALRRRPDASPLAPNALHHGSDPCTLHPAPSTLLMEFPISTVRLFGQNVPISGGGYFRLLPFMIIERGLNRITRKDKRPFIFYLHPWELDDKQPKIECSGLISQFRHHVNLNQTESKLRRLLEQFAFSSVRDILDRNSGQAC
jgi:polysaccharide deacetylase family protein (PEP-CTERM system associated)